MPRKTPQPVTLPTSRPAPVGRALRTVLLVKLVKPSLPSRAGSLILRGNPAPMPLPAAPVFSRRKSLPPRLDPVPIPLTNGVFLSRANDAANRRQMFKRQRIAALKAQKIAGQSLLASKGSVKPATRVDYLKRMDDFMLWARAEHVTVDFADEESVTQAMLEYLDFLFLVKERDVNHGTKFVAAVGFVYPAWRHICRRGILPAVQQALQGYEKWAPGGVRLVLPECLVWGIAAEQTRMRDSEGATLTSVGFDTYLRPTQLVTMTSDMVLKDPKTGQISLLVALRERGVPTKMGEFDVSVPMDTVERSWIGNLLWLRKLAVGPSMPLFAHTVDSWRTSVRAAAQTLGFEIPSVYSFRHAGASADFLTKRRTIPQIKKRGMWKSDKSLARYEQSARCLKILDGLPPTLTRHLQRMEVHARSILTGRLLPPKYTGPLLHRNTLMVTSRIILTARRPKKIARAKLNGFF